METLINISGWAGTLLILWAYFLVSTDKTSPKAFDYQLINLIGAILLGVNVFFKKAWPALALEIIWAAIAIAVLLKFKNTKK